MSIGYACLAVGVIGTQLKSCVAKNATSEKLLELIEHNLNALEKIIDYNIQQNIQLFRISSDIIPFGSSPVNTVEWSEIFSERLSDIGCKIRNANMRVSMHPGQYTVLNSPNIDVVNRAVEDLSYHAKVLDCLGTGTQSKIVLHIGGVYNDKKQAIERFIENYQRLDHSIKSRLVIENDDKSYTIEDVLQISNQLNIPVVFDNLHNKVNPCDIKKDEVYWIAEAAKTWKTEDGKQKIHYSEQAPQKNRGSHSDTITADTFLDFYHSIGAEDIDIMIEVKDKNLSAVKGINCVTNNKNITLLEGEWARYKYKVLEKSHQDYNAIRQLLKDKRDYPVVQFYHMVEQALNKQTVIGEAINAAEHIWGYFKNNATDKEKKVYLDHIQKYKNGSIELKTVKSFLWTLVIKYPQKYLLESYYFIL
jgi:UV DNA damage endonuclease